MGENRYIFHFQMLLNTQRDKKRQLALKLILYLKERSL